MVKFETLVTKGPQGEILANGLYVTGTNPVFVERVVIEELDASGNAVMSSTFHVQRYIDPVVQSSQMLVSKMPSGTNVKGARATAWFVEIDKVAKSPVLNL
ncbi:MAG TPA: hypothetical protein VNC59_00845 [Thermoanaerobaculia bacterium]|nr:hypothetical protein [Thermoanaerobaculia bacterium]